MTRPRMVVWFRSDLRLHDNPLIAQCLAHKGDKEVLPCYIFDTRVFGPTTKFGNAKTGAYRSKFITESVSDLRHRLRAIGSDLLVGIGKPEEILPQLLQARVPDEGGRGATSTLLLSQQHVTSEELRVDQAVRQALPAGTALLKTIPSGSLYSRDELPYRFDLADMPDGFTPFRNKIESKCSIPSPLPPPPKGSLPLPRADTLPKPSATLGFDLLPSEEALGLAPGALTAEADRRGVLPFKGGETAALARLQHYLWDADCLKDYFETRNGMLGPDYSSKFAPWLAQGCLSPRMVAAECARYEVERVKNKSTYWLVFELVWRDFFRWYCEKQGDAVFKLKGPIGLSRPWFDDAELLQRWKEGRTGVPLVDANMRELAATGFMSNRGRQNVASYLALDLGMDWRQGADHFESLLIDYEPTANWGNWVAAAGLTGGRLNRFNIVKQSNDYDKEGEYIRHWIPELAKVPAPLVHEPWKLSRADMQKYGVQIGLDYPLPPKSRFAGAADYYEGGGDTGGRGKGRGGRGEGGGRGGGRGGARGSRVPRVQHGY